MCPIEGGGGSMVKTVAYNFDILLIYKITAQECLFLTIPTIEEQENLPLFWLGSVQILFQYGYPTTNYVLAPFKQP